jgi:hypothetical protein
MDGLRVTTLASVRVHELSALPKRQSWHLRRTCDIMTTDVDYAALGNLNIDGRRATRGRQEWTGSIMHLQYSTTSNCTFDEHR